MADYRFMLPRMRAVRSGENRYYASADPKLMALILERIGQEGLLLMRQFQSSGASRSGSWSWGPLRRAFARIDAPALTRTGSFAGERRAR